MRIFVAMLAALFAAATISAAPQRVATRWLDAQRIEACSDEPGTFIARPAPNAYGTHLGDHPGGCVVFPPDGALIDVFVAPRAGMVYCVVSPSGEECAAPLPPPPRVRVFLPFVRA